MKPPVLVLHVRGTNRDRDVAWACELAGGAPEIVHVNQLAAGERRLSDYRMLVLPGGFSYGDDLGAGRIWATILRHALGDDLRAFVDAGRPVIGICNGFQALVKSGVLPDGEVEATLTRNASNRFECRWVELAPQPESPCVFTRGLDAPIHCPVAHGEGRFVARDSEVFGRLEAAGQIALRYSGPGGAAAEYPWNPNGSAGHVAGICNARGNVLGLMPHPEDHVIAAQGRASGFDAPGLGLPLFTNGLRYAAEA